MRGGRWAPGAAVLTAALLLWACVPPPRTPPPPPQPAVAPRWNWENYLPARNPAQERVRIQVEPEPSQPLYLSRTQLTYEVHPDRAAHPDVSPDGSLLVFSSTYATGTWQIYLLRLGERALTRLTMNHADNLFPRLSPDGQLVAYASNMDGEWNLYVARLEAPQQVLQVTHSREDDIAPAWAPDSRRLAYASRAHSGRWQIVTTDIRSRVPTVVAPGIYPDWSPHADPAQQWIAFQGLPAGERYTPTLQAIRPDGRDLRTVVSHPGWAAVTPRWHPSGEWIFYVTRGKRPEVAAYLYDIEGDDIWCVRPDGRDQTNVTNDRNADWWPAFGGGRLYYVTLGETKNENIYSVELRPVLLEALSRPARPQEAPPETPAGAPAPPSAPEEHPHETP